MCPKVQQEYFKVQVSKYPNSQSRYETRYGMTSEREACFYYHGINIGLGYKKRLVRIVGKKTEIIARSFS